MSIQQEQVREYCTFQANWQKIISGLPQNKYETESVEFLSITGEAPKLFIRIYEYQAGRKTRKNPKLWPGYIAKFGTKFYANESVTEHLLTRIGQHFGIRIADSHLRIIAGQVRFLSRYFLDQATQSLVHGAEILARVLGEDAVREIENEKLERDFYTYQMIREFIQNSFPLDSDAILADFTEMLAFDALIGHNDRHPYNWGVVVPIYDTGNVSFSPVFDTARALFWNDSEEKVRQRLNDERALERYVKKSKPIVSWDGRNNINHIELIELICREFPNYDERIEPYTQSDVLERALQVLDTEFRQLMSEDRRKLIKKCLRLRQSLLQKAVSR